MFRVHKTSVRQYIATSQQRQEPKSRQVKKKQQLMRKRRHTGGADIMHLVAAARIDRNYESRMTRYRGSWYLANYERQHACHSAALLLHVY